MGNAWSKHVGEWYEANKGTDGINRLSDAMRSAKCKADFRAKNGSTVSGPSMKTEKKNEKKAKKGTRKMRGGSTLGSPANFSADPANPVASEPKMNTPATPVMKGGKSNRYSLKELMKFIEKNVGMVKGGSNSKIIKGGGKYGPNVLKLKKTNSFFRNLFGGSTTFNPQILVDSLKDDLTDTSKYRIHHLMFHIEGVSRINYGEPKDKRYLPFTTFDDTDDYFCDYDKKSQDILLALRAYDDDIIDYNVENEDEKEKIATVTLSTGKVITKTQDYVRITKTLIDSLTKIIASASSSGSPTTSGDKQNVIVAFTKNGNAYTNVIRKTSSDPHFHEALAALTKP